MEAVPPEGLAPRTSPHSIADLFKYISNEPMNCPRFWRARVKIECHPQNVIEAKNGPHPSNRCQLLHRQAYIFANQIERAKQTLDWEGSLVALTLPHSTRRRFHFFDPIIDWEGSVLELLSVVLNTPLVDLALHLGPGKNETMWGRLCFCTCMSGGNHVWGAVGRQCATSRTKPYQITTQLHPQRSCFRWAMTVA